MKWLNYRGTEGVYTTTYLYIFGAIELLLLLEWEDKFLKYLLQYMGTSIAIYGFNRKNGQVKGEGISHNSQALWREKRWREYNGGANEIEWEIENDLMEIYYYKVLCRGLFGEGDKRKGKKLAMLEVYIYMSMINRNFLG